MENKGSRKDWKTGKKKRIYKLYNNEKLVSGKTTKCKEGRWW